ncbi:two component transcriptional regulator, LuxR family protein [Plesiocystis pacifica SIR-1]|uniref:Two component transcriptional regulator, LuxR family protein n=1 Tax=Plesiocystis pacifica SIR-1 TaxID=391625 RepID=A6GCA3_9BACT|nr:response regulator transcription factor [Plesiocystis pacifica]EDM76552.1 two component transcriptional regulator, LuxR family protein [Plesiocystis pacifica SIR-1]
MFDRHAALAQAPALTPTSLTAIPVAIVSDDPKVKASVHTRLTAARELAVVDDPGQARVLIWDAHTIEEEDGLPRLPAAADEASVQGEPPALVALLPDGVDPLPLLAVGVRALVARDAGTQRLRASVLAAELGLVVLDEDPSDALVASWSPGEEPEASPAPTPAPAKPEPRVANKPASAPENNLLTPREREVLELLADGLSNRNIGERLGISAHTVKFHVDALLDKLDARSRTQAVVQAIRRGLLELA